MESKEDILKQLDEIHSSLLDSEKFMPYNFNVIIMWGVVSILLFLFASYMFEQSIYIGITFLITMLSGGGAVEYFLTKKENKKYDIQNFTKIQKFIEKVFTLNMIFGILISIVLVQNELVSYIYLIWVFLIGVAGYIVGFTINSKIFLKHGTISAIMSLVLFAFNILFDFSMLNQAFAVISLGFGYIYLGIKLKKECKSV